MLFHVGMSIGPNVRAAGKAAGRRRLDRDAAREVLEPGAVVDRQALQRPRVLRVDADIGMEPGQTARRGEFRIVRRGRDAVQKNGADVAVGGVRAAIRPHVSCMPTLMLCVPVMYETEPANEYRSGNRP